MASQTFRSPIRQQGITNPLDRISIFSKAVFSYVEPLLRKGTSGARVNPDDVYKIYKGGTCEELTNNLKKHWHNEWMNHQKGYTASLARAVCKAFWKQFIMVQIFCFGEDFGRIVQPVLMSWILDFLSGHSDMSSHQAWLCVVSVGGLTLLQAFTGPQISFELCRASHMWQKATYGLIYQKILRLSQTDLCELTTGHIVDLINTDSRKYHHVVWHLPGLWLGPLKAIFAFWFLYTRLGAPVIVGYMAIMLLGPLQGCVAKISSNATLKKSEATDKRVQLMSEVITGMRIIKMYCWEKPFGEILSKLRKSELDHLWTIRVFCSILSELYTFNFRIVSTTVLVTATILGYDLKASTIFPMFAMFNVVNESLLNLASWGLKTFFEARVAFTRIEQFLLRPDMAMSRERNTEKPGFVHIENVTAYWDKNVGCSPVLKDINLDLHRGQLVAVVGQVGSGKSSLLSLLSDELFISSGKVQMAGSMTYAPQQPWIFSDTIRENVMFGSEYKPRVLQEVLEVTALDNDLVSLPHGDLTRVGERGVMLSGGQKARLSLARAVYQSADIYLLDDPLSAVDTTVGRHIFDRCIRGYLYGKTRILVTHQLQYIKEADYVVVLENGTVKKAGSFWDIQMSGIDIAQLLPKVEETANERETRQNCMKTSNKLQIISTLTDEELQEEEEMMTSKLGWSVFKKFASRLTKWDLAKLFLMNVLCQIFYNGNDWWLAKWLVFRTQPEFSADKYYLTVFLAITVLVYITGIIRAIVFFKQSIFLSQYHHDKMYSSVIRSPSRFFDLNPSGRILNRFSNDITAIDDDLPDILYDFIQHALILFGTLCVVVYLCPVVLLPSVILLVFLYKSRARYLNTDLDCLSLIQIARSPITTHLKATLDGIQTIRALGRQDVCVETFNVLADRMHGRIVTSNSVYSWYSFRMNLTVAGFTILAMLVFMFSRQYVDHTMMAMAFSYLVPTMWQLNTAGRLSTELATFMTQLERLLEYSSLPPEAPLQLGNKPANWPSIGSITMEEVNLKYTDTGPKVLNNISVHIKPKEKVGIVGRTGAGKSSLIQALFRMTEPVGKIYIDGVDICKLGLHDLRGNISIIPQDPTLFGGPIRRNLDPFDQHTRQEIMQALREVQLDTLIRNLPGGLDSLVTEGGANFSVGQRQLLCLARAILRHNKILVMDEATANVDTRTDELIQEAIRRTFNNCTVITIAHRLHTVMDSDRIMVIDSGRVVEFDSPHSLLQNSKGYLSSLVAETGSSEEHGLREIAQKTYSRQNIL